MFKSIRKMEKYKNLIYKINNGFKLNESESNFLAEIIVDQELDNYQIVSILTLLFVKGEKYEEIYAFVKILRKKMNKISLGSSIMDTCGTGGDHKNSFNFSSR